MKAKFLIAATVALLGGCTSMYAHKIVTFEKATLRPLIEQENQMVLRICMSAGEKWQVLWVCESIAIDKNNHITTLQGSTRRWFYPLKHTLTATMNDDVLNVSYGVLSKKCDYEIKHPTSAQLKTDSCAIEYINNISP